MNPPTGIEIPQSFRARCDCCGGEGRHLVCGLTHQDCRSCDGTGWVLNRLGHDLYRLLAAADEVTEA
jgi:hypothetical protein